MIAAVRIRGNVKTSESAETTLVMLHLKYVNNATLVPNTAPYVGMLKRAKDLITWGEASPEMIAQLLKKRAMTTGENRLTDEYLSKNSGYRTIDGFAKALAEDKATLKDVKGLKPRIRLHPPKKGHKKGIKKTYVQGGSLGPRGEKINELLLRMI